MKNDRTVLLKKRYRQVREIKRGLYAGYSVSVIPDLDVFIGRMWIYGSFRTKNYWEAYAYALKKAKELDLPLLISVSIKGFR